VIWYGGDYNPEQWPEAIWAEDARLMREAGVTMVSVGIFSWAMLEPREGEFDFGWLDRVIDVLHAAGVRVDLATATASPPPWLTHRYPEALPVTKDGVRLSAGSRQQYCPSSPVYRRLAARLASKIAEHYAEHPALSMWHINNEYGCHVSHCYCETSGDAFRAWLEARYGTVDALNAAWGTAFWSQRYSEFAEVEPPRAMPSFGNPGQLLDFDRFSADQLLELFQAEAAIVRASTPSIPVTTNFMGFFKGADYWAWAQEVDVVSDDSYADPADPVSPAYAAMTRDLMRSLRHGQPWILMEQAPSAVNWRARNAPKAPGQMAAWSKQAVARGADGILFFQWRQSVAGAEKFHSGMVPHAGTDTRVWREICELGSDLAGLAEIEGSRVDARVAIVFEWDSWRSLEQRAVPTTLSYVDHVFAWYAPLFERNVVADFVRADADLSGYDAVVVPSLFCATPAALDNLAAYAEGGGHLVVTFQTGIVDQNMHITSGGYLGSLQATLGVRIEEFAPLALPDPRRDGAGTPPTVALEGVRAGTGALWTEQLRVTDAEVLSVFGSGALAGSAAVTRRANAWYVATRPDPTLTGELLDDVLASAGVATDPGGTVERVQRGRYRFSIDHGSQAVQVEAMVKTGASDG
jgi:beta-galactosidase